jgi:hypothetical protein
LKKVPGSDRDFSTRQKFAPGLQARRAALSISFHTGQNRLRKEAREKKERERKKRAKK